MVARRLLVLMLVMLVIASLSSLFLSEPGQRTATRSQTTTSEATERSPGERAAPAVEGRLLQETLRASAPQPRTIAMRTGDQLALRVDARRPAQVELVGLGQLEDVFPPAPTRFDLYADRPGRFPVRLLPARRTIGVIEVAEPEAAKSKPG